METASIPVGEPDSRLKTAIVPHREASRKNGLKVIDDRQYRVAGCPAWIFSTEKDERGSKMRVVTICFVSAKHDYIIAVAGQADFFEDTRPKVMQWIGSLRLDSSDKQEK